MKKRFLCKLVFILLVSQMSFSQSISKREFNKTNWFTSNKDSLFFKSDTVKFIKYSNKSIKENSNVEFYPESFSFYDVESIQLLFLQKKYMNFLKRDFHFQSVELNRWILNKKDSTLILKNKNRIKYSFKIILLNDLEFENNGQKFTTKEMILRKQ